MDRQREMWVDTECVRQEAIHVHTEMEVIYVVSGQGELQMQGETWQLHQQDIVLVSPGVPHALTPSPRLNVCTISYAWPFLRAMVGQEPGCFSCNSVTDHTRSYQHLRSILQQLVHNQMEKQHKSPCLEYSLLYRVLNELVERFYSPSAPRLNSEDERMQHIFRYVNENFQTSISLTKLAQELFVSPSTLSRLFKKKMGIYFADYVNDMRLRYATKKLIHTQENVTQIAVESGFSNLSVFNRAFREAYSTTPSEYRRQQAQRQVPQDVIPQQEEGMARGEENAMDISANVVCYRPLHNVWKQMMNIGPLDLLLLANIQQHVVFLKESLGFSYVRLWNLFSVPMMMTDGARMGYYQYDRLDMVLDFLVDHQLKPFLDVGVRPRTAVKSEGKVVYFREERVEFQSQRHWEHMVADFAEHIVKRYGAEEVGSWIFELSHDIIHPQETQCYHSQHYRHIEAYAYLYRTLKRLCPTVKVGGPGAIVGVKDYLTISFLDGCKKYDCLPDFISMFLFPYETNVEQEQVSRRRLTAADAEVEMVRTMRTFMQQQNIHCPIYVTEWNHSISTRDYLNDSCFRSSYMVSRIQALHREVDLLGVWMATDWVSHYLDTAGSIASGGCGLVTKDRILKPAYFALSLLNRVGDGLIDSGDGYMVTRSSPYDFYVICTHFAWLEEECVACEDVAEPEQMENLVKEHMPCCVSVALEHLPFENCIVKKRSLSPHEGTLLREWARMQYTHRLDKADVRYLQQACYPRMSMERVAAPQGTLSYQLWVDRYEVVLLHIYPDKEQQ